MKIAIAGYGIEGEENYRYFSSLGHDVMIVDEHPALDRPVPEGARTMLGEGVFAKLDEFDMIVRTAGLPPRKLPYPSKVWSMTNEFLSKCPVPVIGVTGTKGKGTTSSLIASILRAAGKNVHLVGNIGVPALSVLGKIQDDDIVVYELSSFQLWDAQFSPDIAVVLPIEADHLDVHDSMIDYINAKSHIATFQSADDVVVYHANNANASAIALQSPASKRPYPQPIGALVEALRIPGQHNIENASAAIEAIRDYVTDSELIAKGLAAFDGLPHRLKFVAEKDDIKYYDDSIATTPGSVIAALHSFNVPVTVLLGGKDKGADYREMIDAFKKKDAQAVCYGSNGGELALMCKAAGIRYELVTGSMSNVVQAAATFAQRPGVVILSPAASSFDMFKNYVDRGEQFIAAVTSL